MDDKARSDDEVQGHGLEGERTDVSRRLRTGVESGNADPELVNTGTGIPGNSSETGAGTPPTDDGANARRIRPRSPLGPGCGRNAGAMLIAAVSTVAVAIRYRR